MRQLLFLSKSIKTHLWNIYRWKSFARKLVRGFRPYRVTIPLKAGLSSRGSTISYSTSSTSTRRKRKQPRGLIPSDLVCISFSFNFIFIFHFFSSNPRIKRSLLIASRDTEKEDRHNNIVFFLFLFFLPPPGCRFEYSRRINTQIDYTLPTYWWWIQYTFFEVSRTKS